jgi:methyl-accepting chemotaxis protein
VVLVGGMHVYAESEINQYSEAVEKARGIFDLGDKIEIELLDSRRAERDFLNRNDRKKAEVQQRIGKVVAADINDLYEKLQAIGKDDLAGKVDAMSKSLKQYQTSFVSAVDNKVCLGLDENSGLEGRLRGSVHDIEEKVNQLNQSDLVVTMLMMRQHEKDFMLRRDDKYSMARLVFRRFHLSQLPVGLGRFFDEALLTLRSEKSKMRVDTVALQIVRKRSAVGVVV